MFALIAKKVSTQWDQLACPASLTARNVQVLLNALHAKEDTLSVIKALASHSVEDEALLKIKMVSSTTAKQDARSVRSAPLRLNS